MFFDILIVAIKVLVGIGCGLLVLFVFAKVNTLLSSLPSYWDELEAEFITERMNLNADMVELLYKIGKPLDNGRFSPEQMLMWKTYKTMNTVYEELFAKHTEILINKRK